VTGVRVSGVTDFDALGLRWRALEAGADCSFFQTWTWVGCLARERYPDPVLVEATESGRTVALALFNRARGALYLHESGSAELDCPYIEQNGVLAQAGRVAELTALCLRAVTRRYRVVLSGVGDSTVAAARGAAMIARVSRSQASPCADLAAVRRAGGCYLAGLSANTRQQIRRSDRFYGAVAAEAADSVGSARAALDEMAVLHQASWAARGKPGSFARPFFRRFHHALLGAAVPRGEALLVRVSYCDTTIGILYNFRFRRRMLAYQSGFAYAKTGRHAKPGLTCHHAAIRLALEQDIEIYDFLAGEDRYKRSLSDCAHSQAWIEAGPFWSPRLLGQIAGGIVRSAIGRG
jgi:CelD/BcsL family acetyltransferase involved in cellulose biosynthesis